ncbi:hypothetical protein ACQ7BN_08180 [Streptococcus suis]|uniref:hypothetical protein n=1 Tax=Streptococcus suis TaxID=1307 RepID=UPI003D364BD9|nr:hypothetical protein [Streptococcus suis]
MCALCERDPFTGHIVYEPCLKEKMTDPVKKPSHWHGKNGLEDLKKARQNLDWLIETLERENNHDLDSNSII